MYDNIKDSVAAIGTFFTIWLVHYFLGNLLQKAKFYNSFFENDYDGVLETRVISKALGKEIAVVEEELKVLYSLKLLINSRYERGLVNAVLLKNVNAKILNPETSIQPKVTSVVSVGKVIPEEEKVEMITLVCPHCGASNQVLPGFVHQCEFCSGSLEKEEIGHVSE